MAKTDVAAGSIDLIWAEGSIYVVGMERALAMWRPWLRPGGCVAFSDFVQWTGSLSKEARGGRLYVSEMFPISREASMHKEDNLPAPRDEVLFDIEMALSKEEKLWPKRPRPGDHNRLRPMARAILEHLELCGLRFFRKPPAPRHSTPDPWGSAGTGKESG